MLGDVLEVLAAFALIGAAYLFAGPVLALAIVGGGLFYFAQQYAQTPLPRRTRRNPEGG